MMPSQPVAMMEAQQQPMAMPQQDIDGQPIDNNNYHH